ncbi:MAG TPA: thiamine pyrophosphate-dependent enzyme [Anaerolineales bacterium]|nr:thiamine pyrophosphate-dependent enzyme [Anaerolineales bacterium]
MTQEPMSSAHENLGLSTKEILDDYFLGVKSRQASLIGRREVMSGKAKFGIFGDGKEVPQLAMAKVFQNGDFRSGYYRDQTLMFAIGALSLQEFFAQLYAHADLEAEPATAGRAMNAHFATRSLDEQGNWKDLTSMVNSSADVSPTASQMPRLVGLAYASRLYRSREDLKDFSKFSKNGNEVAFGTIGNASCAEGIFWESVNAIGVLKSPAIITIYDDEFGISVPNEFQIAKSSLSELLKGFQREAGSSDGYDVYVAHGWNYPELIQVYRQAAQTARNEHIPAIIHVIEVTQPQGHSTSGSHERYKSTERLEWEIECDGLKVFRRWILAQGLVNQEELEEVEKRAQQEAEQARKAAWEAFTAPVDQEQEQLIKIFNDLIPNSSKGDELQTLIKRLRNSNLSLRRDLAITVNEALFILKEEDIQYRRLLIAWREQLEKESLDRYSSYLYQPGKYSALRVAPIQPEYSAESPMVSGFDILNACFDRALAREPRLVAFGEDVGKLGDVNQAFRGLQAKYGELTVTDTGIREATILGQAIGLALRGLRPIAEIQYLDYVLYALQLMSDDLATLLWRTRGGQRAPVIMRTRGHRLEGIWHSGSLMAGIINLVRGMHVAVPRDMTRAAGFYNTFLEAEEPALVVEVLNSYRSKEKLPTNIGEIKTPIGIPEILRTGTDLTIVTYGACCKITLQASEMLAKSGIEAEVIDVQTLLPFDIHNAIVKSLQKTNRILFVDEDVPGGTTAYMLQQVLEKQAGYYWLDSSPKTLCSKPHRPAYGSDGDYWSKPNAEEIFQAAYRMMNETDPKRFPIYFSEEV